VRGVTDCPPDSRRPRLGELIGVAVIVFVVIMGTAKIEPSAAERPVDALAFVCGIGAALSLLLWRRSPLVMVAIVATAIFTYLARSYPPGPALLPGPVSLVLLGFTAKRSAAWTGALVVWAAVTLGLTIGDGRGDRLALAAVGWTLAAVLAGQLLAARRERTRVERERTRMAEHQAVTDERLRIAQDLHDSVAHAMATINVQAGTAAHLLAHRPDKVDATQLESSLVTIRRASAEVLDELGAILGVLRRDSGGQVLLQPHVGLEQIGELIDRARADGVHVEGTPLDRLPTASRAVSEAGYRVVQEALSNVRRHARPGAKVRVDVVASPGSGLTIEVVDDGGVAPPAAARQASPRPAPPAPPVHEGFGLIGMRERVEASGGELVARPAEGGGFRVAATWPAP
jgi:signal transduction histidine kinase